MKEVARTHSLSWAHSVRIALEAEGIEPVIQNEFALGFINLAGELRILVNDEEFESARAVVASLEKRPTQRVPVSRAWKWQRRGLCLLAVGMVAAVVGGFGADALGRPWATSLSLALVVALFVFGAVFIVVGFTLEGKDEPRDGAA